MIIAGLRQCSLSHGPGKRFVILLPGCHMNCSGCAAALAPDAGTRFSLQELTDQMELQPELEGLKIPSVVDACPVKGHRVEADGCWYETTLVGMGNPHAVIFVDDPDTAPVITHGPILECHPDFPRKINVEFVQVVDDSHIRMRVWERGTGETLACGTGACASAVACALNGLCGRMVEVELLGGKLQIEWSKEDNHVYMTGPATFVYDGVWLKGQ